MAVAAPTVAIEASSEWRIGKERKGRPVLFSLFAIRYSLFAIPSSSRLDPRPQPVHQPGRRRVVRLHGVEACHGRFIGIDGAILEYVLGDEFLAGQEIGRAHV